MFYKNKEVTAEEMMYEHMLGRYGRCCGLCARAVSFVDQLAGRYYMKCEKTREELPETALLDCRTCFEQRYK